MRGSKLIFAAALTFSCTARLEPDPSEQRDSPLSSISESETEASPECHLLVWPDSCARGTEGDDAVLLSVSNPCPEPLDLQEGPTDPDSPESAEWSEGFSLSWCGDDEGTGGEDDATGSCGGILSETSCSDGPCTEPHVFMPGDSELRSVSFALWDTVPDGTEMQLTTEWTETLEGKAQSEALRRGCWTFVVHRAGGDCALTEVRLVRCG